MGNFYRRFIFIVAVGVFSSIGFAANAENKVSDKPKVKSHPNYIQVSKLYLERETITSQKAFWSLQRGEIEEFKNLMIQNPSVLDDDKKDYYISLLNNFDEASSEIHSALVDTYAFKGNELDDLSKKFILYSAAIKALLQDVAISQVEDIFIDYELEEPKLPVFIGTLKNQSKMLTGLLKAYSARSFYRYSSFVKIHESVKHHSEYKRDIEKSSDLIEFYDDQIEINEKLLSVLIKDLYSIEPGSVREKEILEIIEIRERRQHFYSTGHLFQDVAREKIENLSLYLSYLINNTNESIVDSKEKFASLVPYVKTKESKVNSIKHIQVYSKLDAAYEEETSILLLVK